jgi:hypothetical protein
MLCIMRLHSSIIFVIPCVLPIMPPWSDMPGGAADPGASCACSAGDSVKPMAAARMAMDGFFVFICESPSEDNETWKLDVYAQSTSARASG